jgi:isoleucyl-tRNA synthetase
VGRIQAMRKDAGFNIEDRITTYYVSGMPDAGNELGQIMQVWADYIRAETLTTHLSLGQPPVGAYQETQKVDGMTLTLGVVRNQR